MLEGRQLAFTYPGGTRALADFDFRIARGEKLAVLGANGAGKSTLFMLLNGSIRPDHGVVVLNGQEIGYGRKDLIALRSQIGVVLQDPDDQLFAATVAEDVSFGPLNQGLGEAEARMRVREALDAMGIAALAERPTHMLSFGQKKRAAIAGILAMRPDFLLLDEPTAGLDPLGMRDLMATLDEIAAKGSAVVIATHDIDAAYGWADRIMICSGGSVIVQGEPQEVFADAALIGKAGIEQPLLYRVFRMLQQTGAVAPGLPPPRNLNELEATLR